MTTPDPAAVITRALAGYLVPGHRYHSPLPDDLAPWYCYTHDGGHSILVAVPEPGRALSEEELTPAPVKAVLKAGWRTDTATGLIVSDLTYDPVLGLVTDPDDDEYADNSPASVAQQAALHRYSVGELYNPKVTRWPDGRGELRLTPAGADFVLFYARPKPHEIQAFTGNAEFAVINRDHVMLLLYAFTDPHDSDPKNGLPWSDAPWEYHRQVAAGTSATLPDDGFPLHLLLVDADTGILRAQRITVPSPEFADVLRQAIVRQNSHPADPAAATREIQALYDAGDSRDLLLHADARFEALRDGTI
ncbi:hypothetical protein [Kitasatospora sp. NPDC059327]|uniref:hypothetical protein n=1 Tax=Kitasatospora sp. NPDC059327 TaxID=3346803 RepID=UPI0036B1AD54